MTFAKTSLGNHLTLISLSSSGVDPGINSEPENFVKKGRQKELKSGGESQNWAKAKNKGNQNKGWQNHESQKKKS